MTFTVVRQKKTFPVSGYSEKKNVSEVSHSQTKFELIQATQEKLFGVNKIHFFPVDGTYGAKPTGEN